MRDKIKLFSDITSLSYHHTGQHTNAMWRASPRRILFCLGGFLSGLLLLGNIHQTFKSITVNVINQEELVKDAIKNKTVIKESSTEAKGKEEAKPELSSLVSPSLPWYMEGGLIRPGHSESTSNEKERKLALFPDEAPGEDRIASKNLVRS